MTLLLRGLQLLPRIGQRICQITSSVATPRANLINSRLLSSLTACQCPEKRLLPGPAVLGNNQALTCVSPLFQQPCRTYKVRTTLRRRCSSCYFVRRHGRLYVECKAKPRHKQMQQISPRNLWKEDYSKGPIQSAINWYWRHDRYHWLGNTKYAKYNWLDGKIGRTV